MTERVLRALFIACTALFAVTIARPSEPPGTGEVSACTLLSKVSKYAGSEVWVRGRVVFAPPDFGLTLEGCGKAVGLTWNEDSAFEKSIGRKALDVAQQALFKSFTRADHSATVRVIIAGSLRRAGRGRYAFEVTRLGSITIKFPRSGPVKNVGASHPRGLGGPKREKGK